MAFMRLCSSLLNKGNFITQEGDSMVAFNSGGLSHYDSDYDVDELLEQYDTYIGILARQKIPRNVIPLEMLSDEIDELAQRIRIKLWQISQKKQIIYPKAYISCIAYTESVDIVRHYKATLSLLVHKACETHQCNSNMVANEGVQDPSEKLEQEEVRIEWIKRVVEEICKLPPRQQHAILCSLKDQIEDFLPLIEALRNRGVEIEEMDWPNEREEVQRLRASLSIARKKLNTFRDNSAHG
jgi:DNA-directed RNA polymerase specialized sigma24 family protein